MLSKFRCKDNAIFADAQIFLRNFCNFAAVNEDNAALRWRFFLSTKITGNLIVNYRQFFLLLKPKEIDVENGGKEIDGNLIKIDGN